MVHTYTREKGRAQRKETERKEKKKKKKKRNQNKQALRTQAESGGDKVAVYWYD